jgi:hypothetical protein
VFTVAREECARKQTRTRRFVDLKKRDWCERVLIATVLEAASSHASLVGPKQVVGRPIALPNGIMSPTDQLDCLESSTACHENVELVPNPPAGLRYQRHGVPVWFRRVFSFLLVLAMLVAVLEFLMARSGMNDPDIWWHLRNAEYLVQNHQLPRQDAYSFTVAGQPWINHEWLAELPFYFAWRASGVAGLKTLTILIIQLIFLGLLYLCYKETGNFKASVAACALSTFLATISFGPRTILFGYGYLIVLLIILQRFRRVGHAPLWVVPPLFCLWINTHGSWSLGVVIFLIFCGSGLIEGSWGRVDSERWTPRQFRQLLLTGVGSAAALFVNPFGHRLVFYPLDMAFRQKLNIAHVAEWVSVDFHQLRGKIVLGLLLALLGGALVRNRRWNLAELGLLAFALYSGLTYVRFLFLLAIVAAPIVAKLLDFFPPYREEEDTPVLNAFVVAAMIAGMLYFWPASAQLQPSIDAEYPAQAMSVLKAHPPDGPILSFYLWGGYLGWNDRNIKVFIDSRVDIFEYAGVLKDYLDALDPSSAGPVLDKYKIRYVLFPSREPLSYALEHDPGWKVLYRDQLTELFQKKDMPPPAATPR